MTAQLFAHSGIYGTSSAPIGSALATSTTSIVINGGISGTQTWYDFNFDGTYTLAAGTNYCIASIITGGAGDGVNNYVTYYYNSAAPTHGGNRFTYEGPDAWSSASQDLLFMVYTDAPADSYDSASLTDAAATTNRLGSGTGSFVAGEISETGVVTDFLLTANNYTEFLYSLTLKSADLAHGDTLRFRVLRNGATTGITYTQTPTINVTMATNSSARFDGSGERYTGPSIGVQSAYTMCCWVMVPTIPSGGILQSIESLGNSGTQNSELSLLSNGTTNTLLAIHDGGASQATRTIAAGQWAFCAYVYVAGGRKLYLWRDGDSSFEVLSLADRGTGTFSASVLYIGRNFAGDPLNGRVAAVKVWTAALSQADLNNERKGYNPVRTANLWGSYSFWGGPSTLDESGNGRNLTATGTMTAEAGPPISQTATGIAYDETGRSVAITAATTVTDALYTLPDPPTSLAGTPGAAQVSLTWSAPVSDGGSPILDYIVQYRAVSGDTVLFTDDFNRANGTLTTPWVGGWEISSNKAIRSTGTEFALYGVDLGTLDHYIEADVYAASFGVINIRRPSDNSWNGILAFIHPDSGHAVIGYVNGGSYSDLEEGTDVYETNTVSGIGEVTHRLRLEGEGTAVRFYVDGALALTATAPSIPSGNYVGFNAADSQSLFDNFECGIPG